MQSPWSERVAQRYHLELAQDLRAWFDEGLWKTASGAEFRWSQSPEQLLDPEPGTIWAGFMLPDTLPLIGNRYGDWLCLRVGTQGEIREVIYWCHGGGDWIPYGRSLAEALCYDAAFRLVYPQREGVEAPSAADDPFRAARWASQFFPDARQRMEQLWAAPDVLPFDPLQVLLEAQVAEVPVRRDLILRHLETQLKTKSDPRVAQEIGAAWEPDFVSWLFDTALIPELRRGDLSQRFRVPIDELVVQDWEAAERQAVKVCELRQDLGWAFDIAGWAAERRGDFPTAINRYTSGLRASAFADESTKFRTHWFSEGYGKFSAARLAVLKQHLSPDASNDPFLQIFWKNDPESLRVRVRDYWMGQAQEAYSAGRFLDAYHAYYAAGWDLGLQYLKSYEEVFDGLIASAQAAQAPALAAVAALHRRFLS